MSKTIIRGAQVVTGGEIHKKDVLINGDKIMDISPNMDDINDVIIINAEGLYLLPGVIDDQVHFREPGLTHKADIHSESRAAIAGGITSFMEMPNTIPQAVTIEELEKKYTTASERSMANFSFFMGTTNHNLDEILKADPKNVCGIKIFMGSSTGNMLVDDKNALENIFKNAQMIIATHCEDEETIRKNMSEAIGQYGEDIPFDMHPVIRSEDACYRSSSLAVSLAKKFDTRLHILHISTAKELSLFQSGDLGDKLITSEACIHHLWFSEEDYASKGAFIKWNPAVKKKSDRDAILEAVISDKIDVIATDHAPHTLDEKKSTYTKAPSGGPLVQHSLVAMLDLYHQGKISLEKIVEKMCHSPARLFDVTKRGFIKEGYFADLVLVDLNDPWAVQENNILYKCGWSPFSNHTFQSKVTHTIINGEVVYERGKIKEDFRGSRLTFDR